MRKEERCPQYWGTHEERCIMRNLDVHKCIFPTAYKEAMTRAGVLSGMTETWAARIAEKALAAHLPEPDPAPELEPCSMRNCSEFVPWYADPFCEQHMKDIFNLVHTLEMKNVNPVYLPCTACELDPIRTCILLAEHFGPHIYKEIEY